ncbi:hypothetical protein [Anaerolentibacter hominis]|uniref:hypothetical protein n=1 Tax=Anaerolentibacter hominis TaxID=3079009 RepID=UPI0031B81208
MTYKNAKKVIQSGNYDPAVMRDMLDTFLLRSRITQVEYDELMTLITTKAPVANTL